MKRSDIYKLNSGHQKILKAIWEQKRKEKAETKDSKLESQTTQPVPTATAAATVKSN